MEHILVFFSSPNGRDNWQPVERENLPDWIRDDDVILRLMAGEKVRNSAEKVERYFRVVEPVRPRPFRDLGQESGKSQGGIVLLH